MQNSDLRSGHDDPVARPAATALTLYGNVDIRQVQLAFNGSDRIDRMLVREGESVRRGQLLATLDSAHLQHQAALLEAQLAAQQQGLLGAFFFMVPAIILSGFATPIENMLPLVQALTLLNPLRYFLVVLRGVFLQGTPFHLLLQQFFAMASIGVVSLAIAAWLFRHRMY